MPISATMPSKKKMENTHIHTYIYLIIYLQMFNARVFLLGQVEGGRYIVSSLLYFSIIVTEVLILSLLASTVNGIFCVASPFLNRGEMENVSFEKCKPM